MRKRTILLIEDEEILAIDTEHRLKRRGYDVLTVSNGIDALKMVEGDGVIDLVLSDIDLGDGMNGVETARAILSYRYLPIVFLTSQTDLQYADRVRSVSSYGYALKSSHDVVLYAILDTAFDLFEEHQRAREQKEFYATAEARLRRAQRLANVGSWEIELSTGVVRASEEARRIYGIYEKSLTIERIQTVPLPAYREPLDRALKRLIEGKGEYDETFRVRNVETDEVRWVHSVADFDPTTHTVLGTIQDITTEKELEAKVLYGTERLKSALEATGAAVWEWNIESGETFYDDRWASMLGFTPEELTPATIETFRRLCHPDDLSEVNRRLREHLDGRTEVYRVKFRLRHHDGAYRWVIYRGRVVERSAEGMPLRMIGTHVDITERRRWEIEVERLQKQLTAAEEITSTGSWEHDLVEDRIYWSEGVNRLLHMRPVRHGVSLGAFLRIIYPEDRERVRELYLRSIESAKPLDVVYRVMRHPGTVRTLRSRTSLVRDGNGKLVRVLGTLQDVSGT